MDLIDGAFTWKIRWHITHDRNEIKFLWNRFGRKKIDTIGRVEMCGVRTSKNNVKVHIFAGHCYSRHKRRVSRGQFSACMWASNENFQLISLWLCFRHYVFFQSGRSLAISSYNCKRRFKNERLLCAEVIRSIRCGTKQKPTEKLENSRERNGCNSKILSSAVLLCRHRVRDKMADIN